MVYAVQNTHRKDAGGVLVPVHDVTPAERFGDVQWLLGKNYKPWDTENIIAELRVQLIDFSDNDFIVPIGNPLMIALAITVASQVNNGKVSVLQWSGRKRSYSPIDCDLAI